MDHHLIALDAVQAQQKDSPCPKDLAEERIIPNSMCHSESVVGLEPRTTDT